MHQSGNQSQQTDVIRAKLATLSESMEVALGPALSEVDVVDFEAGHGIRLPSAYRLFLTSVGHGGFGPTYGLLTLDQWNQGLGKAEPDNLVRPYPLAPDTTTPIDGRHHDETQLRQGVITVVYAGCTEFTYLVVTGAARGRLVQDNGFTQPQFLLDVNFLAWYERWLDVVAEGYDLTWFADGIAGDEPDLARTLLTDPSPTRRNAAACTLIARPALGPQAIDVLAHALTTDQASRVRQSVIRALGSCGDAEREHVGDALDDADPQVRHLASIVYSGIAQSELSLPGHRRQRLLERLQIESDPDVRGTLERALTQSRTIVP